VLVAFVQAGGFGEFGYVGFGEEAFEAVAAFDVLQLQNLPATEPSHVRELQNLHYRLRWEEAQGSYVLLYPEGIVQLNGTAAEIMKQCVRHASFDRVLSETQALYPAEPVEADVREFLEEAIAHGWIIIDRS
jgi:pyrroloquinoline quinone biosynthesis protein D